MQSSKISKATSIGLIIALACTVPAAFSADIPRPVRDTAYDWRCLGPDGVASTHVRQDTAIWQCQTSAAANPGVTYYIQGGIYRVLVPGTTPACPEQPASETRTAACPAGQTGSWDQASEYASASPPTCWTPGLWLPADPPAGACVTPPPLPAPLPTLAGWLVDGWKYAGDKPPVIPATPPLVTLIDLQTADYADNPKYAPPLGSDFYILRGRRLFDLPAGTYSITVASDDGVRVWAGSKIVVDMWLDQAATPKTYSFAHTGGVFEFRWEHYEAQSLASLSITNPVVAQQPPPASDTPLPATLSPVLSVAPGNRYLRRDGQPFYYVADTGWLISWQLSTAQITQYLEDRASKGVKVIQGPIIGLSRVLSPYDGGADDPFIDSVPMRLNESWWVTTDHAVKEAARLGMTIAIAPVWGSDNDRIFVNPARHVEFVSLLAKRYSNQAHVLWIAAGEYDKITDDEYVRNNRPLNAAELARYNAITTALRANAHPQSLITYHPDGWSQVSTDFGLDARVQFNMLQSSSNLHENIRRVPIERASTLTKPVIEAETGYESTIDNPWRQRVPAYHTLMQGGAGYTYGHGVIWQFAAGWQTALQAEGGVDVLTHYRSFAESIHAEGNTPAQELVLTPGDISDGSNSYATALRSGDRSRLHAFVSNGRTFNLNTATMAAGNLSARWYNPRDGVYLAPFPVARSTSVALDPPGNEAQGNDWALVIETAAASLTGRLSVPMTLPTENEDGTPVRAPLSVEIMYGSVIAAAAYADGLATVTAVLPGTYTARARVTDADGETSYWSASVSASTQGAR